MTDPPVVVDMECFRYRNYEWIVKEIAVYGDFIDTISLREPYPITNLPPAVQKQFRWYTIKLHGMTWNSGRYPYERLYSFVESVKLRYPNSCFYAKGHDKCLFLSRLFNREFHDLEEYGSPKYEDLEKVIGSYCPEYPLIHWKNSHCARKKAKAFGSWFSSYIADSNHGELENELIQAFDDINLRRSNTTTSTNLPA